MNFPKYYVTSNHTDALNCTGNVCSTRKIIDTSHATLTSVTCRLRSNDKHYSTFT